MNFFVLIFFIFLSFLFGSPAFAQDLEIVCNDSGCSPSILKSVFPSSEIWYPGKTLAKIVRIINNSQTSQNIFNNIQNKQANPELEKIITISIKEKNSDVIIWGGPLTDFYKTGTISLATILPSSFNDFLYTASMDDTALNQYQNTTTSFDLAFSFLNIINSPTISYPSPSSTDLSTVPRLTIIPTTIVRIGSRLNSRNVIGANEQILGEATPSANLSQGSHRWQVIVTTTLILGLGLGGIGYSILKIIKIKD